MVVVVLPDPFRSMGV